MKLKWAIMEHPSHSQNTAPCDFHLFGGRRVRCNEDVKNAVHQWLRAQQKTFYYDGIKKLVGCWENELKSRVILENNDEFSFCNRR
jgi:hypothetical protein